MSSLVPSTQPDPFVAIKVPTGIRATSLLPGTTPRDPKLSVVMTAAILSPVFVVSSISVRSRPDLIDVTVPGNSFILSLLFLASLGAVASKRV